MLRSIKQIYGYQLREIDDVMGSVKDFYFDDESWTVRYLVVDTGGLLLGRHVLISPEAMGRPDWVTMTIPVSLTLEQVRGSPDIDTARPVSRQQEIELRRYYAWPLYWGGFMGPAAPPGYWPSPIDVAADAAQQRGKTAVLERSADVHLRSTKDVAGYHIHAMDGSIGHVDDFILDDENWAIRFLVVDTKNWLPGKKVLMAPLWVEAIDWETRQVRVDLTTDGVKNAPEFDPEAPINREYEERLYDYHGRPKYWQ